MHVTQGRVSRRYEHQRTSARSRQIAAWLLLSGVAIAGCGRLQPPRPSEPVRADPPSKEAVASSPPDEDDGAGFKLYSTLQGKMARMEELLNAIDRFLDDPDFQERLLGDAREFEQLLTESRGLYPTKLTAEDRPGFDLTVDETAATAGVLIRSLEAGDHPAARDALKQLDTQRREAHTAFSY